MHTRIHYVLFFNSTDKTNMYYIYVVVFFLTDRMTNNTRFMNKENLEDINKIK